MTNRQIFATALIIMGVFSLGTFFLRRLRSSLTPAGLKVFVNPPAQVYVNGTNVGLSPIVKFFRPGEAKVQIGTYETIVRLNPQVYTVIRRDLESGDIVSSEPETSGATIVTLVSTSPDSASVSMDGQLLGLTPIPATAVLPGPHTFTVSSPGFVSREVFAVATPEFRLTISVKLAPDTKPLSP